VSLETALESLRRDLRGLQLVLSELLPFIADIRNVVVPVEHLDEKVIELTGGVEEALASLREAAQASQPDGPLEAVRLGLRHTHDALNRVTASYVSLFVADAPEDDSVMAVLLTMGLEGGPGSPWWDWTGAVKTSIEQCAMPLQSAATSLLECWSELVERLARHSVSVQATNIGQQISVRDDQLEAANRVS
jgi:hypothetical protein